jgi:S-adenosylmethionine:tRNA ribosyltransferase-isomerase
MVDSDVEHYQTVYAKHPGAVAAPTAGLHFTRSVLERLAARGIAFTSVTLHVGLDTFRPIATDSLEEHQMHSEWTELTDKAAEEINATRAAGGRIVAVGTTSVRVLETAAARMRDAECGMRNEENATSATSPSTPAPDSPSSPPPPGWGRGPGGGGAQEPMSQNTGDDRQEAGDSEHAPSVVRPFTGHTDLFIRPPHAFRAVDALMTNLHFPRTTLLVLVSTFGGRDLMQRAYDEAVRQRYRFYSYGDAMLIL